MKTVSKKSVAATVFKDLSVQGKTRKEILIGMVEGAGLTHAGAATYFNNFKYSIWTSTVKAPVVDYTTFTNKQLVELYNSKAEKKIVKFRDRATALRRVQELVA